MPQILLEDTLVHTDRVEHFSTGSLTIKLVYTNGSSDLIRFPTEDAYLFGLNLVSKYVRGY